MIKNFKSWPPLKIFWGSAGVLLFLVFLFMFGWHSAVLANETAPCAVPITPGVTCKDGKVVAPSTPGSTSATTVSCPNLAENKKKSLFLPACVYYEDNPDIEIQKACGCRNVNDFLELLIKAANWIFAIVGAAALVMFVYGGYTMLTSAGISEKVNKGKTILVSAVIGLIIVFTAQLGVRFLLRTVVSGGTVNGLQINIPTNTP